MKKVLIVAGALFLILVAGFVAVLVWGQRAGQGIQEKFFRAVMSGDPQQVTAMFHPALREEVDEPVLAVWMRAAKEGLGAFQGLSKTDFSTSVEYKDGAKNTESKGKVLFEKGQAQSLLVFRDDQIVKFEIESERIGKDWFKAGPADAVLYLGRGQTFLDAFAGGRTKDAFAMMHAELQKQVPADKLQAMADQVAQAFGKVQSLKPARDEFDPTAQTLCVYYRAECEKTPAEADVLFRFLGLKGHILGFNMKPAEGAPAASPQVPPSAAAPPQAIQPPSAGSPPTAIKESPPAGPSTPAAAGVPDALKALETARQAGVLTDEEFQKKKARLEAQLRPAASPPELDADSRQRLAALEAARQAGVLSDEEYQKKKAEIEAAVRPAIDPATQRKLDALEAAVKAGVMTPEELAKKKAELLGLSGGPAPAAGEKATAQPLSVGRKGKTYRHAIGFSFWYPEGWTVVEVEGGLRLTPPEPGMKDGSPTELYFLAGESVAGEAIKAADDPQVIQYLDGQIQGLSPALKRTTEPALVPVGKDKGVVLEWQGKTATGNDVRAKAFAVIINDHAVALLAIGVSDTLRQRDADLQAMFTSFGFGEGQKDAALVGSWHLLSTSVISNNSPFETSWSNARAVSDTNSTMILAADGTWTRTDTRHMIAMGAGVSLEDKSQKTRKGRWFAGSGGLHLIEDDNTWDEYKYQVQTTAQGRQLRLVSGGQGQMWQEN